MTITRVGTNQKYADGWALAFGDAPTPPASEAKSQTKSSAAKGKVSKKGTKAPVVAAAKGKSSKVDLAKSAKKSAAKSSAKKGTITKKAPSKKAPSMKALVKKEPGKRVVSKVTKVSKPAKSAKASSKKSAKTTVKTRKK